MVENSRRHQTPPAIAIQVGAHGRSVSRLLRSRCRYLDKGTVNANRLRPLQAWCLQTGERWKNGPSFGRKIAVEGARAVLRIQVSRRGRFTLVSFDKTSRRD
jgi:hypothetical protein